MCKMQSESTCNKKLKALVVNAVVVIIVITRSTGTVDCRFYTINGHVRGRVARLIYPA